MHFDKQFVLTALPKAIFLYDYFLEKITFSIDSRTIEPGQLFVALKGPNYDGHDFIEHAMRKGAAGIICMHEYKGMIDAIDKGRLQKACVILVDDTLHALTTLAHAWRMQFTYPVIAITGSMGKTSTKELVAHVLSLHNGLYLMSRGNQNTLVGVALNMLRMGSEHKGAIFEVGIDRRGQMKKKAALIKPTIAVITAVGHSHMQGLGSLNDIAAEKRDIFSSFSDNNIGIVNGDYLQLAQVGYRHPVIKFGSKTSNQIQARKITISATQTTFILKLYHQKFLVTLPTNHQGTVFNSLAACAVAHLLGVDVPTIIKGIERPIVIGGRFEKLFLKNGMGILINDCYNANPESMKAALLAFEKSESKGKKIAILGDMLELGADSAFWHRQLGRFLRKVPSLDHVILVGKQVRWIKQTGPVRLSIDLVPNWQEAVDKLEQISTDNLLVLVKSSFGINLLNLVERVARKNNQQQNSV